MPILDSWLLPPAAPAPAAEDGKLTLWVSDPSKIRKTQVFELALTFKGTVDPRR